MRLCYHVACAPPITAAAKSVWHRFRRQAERARSGLFDDDGRGMRSNSFNSVIFRKASGKISVVVSKQPKKICPAALTSFIFVLLY